MNKLNKYQADNDTFYFTNDMLEKNIFIEEATVQDGDKFETWIEVYHTTEEDSMVLRIHDGSLLSPIQLRRIILDLQELFESNPNGFIEEIKDLSLAFKSASMQDKEINKRRVKDEIDNRFTYLMDVMGRGSE